MGFTLGEVENKINILADKLGSDFFPTPVLVEILELTTLDFIGERLKIFEKTQEVSDDISNLITPLKIPIISNPDTSFPEEYIAGIPPNYLRLLSYGVIYDDLTNARRPRLMKNSQYEAMRLDPNNSPTKFYPIIAQLDSVWKIYSGSSNTPAQLKIVFCKNPTMAGVTQLNTRVVNLSDEAITKIIYSTVTRLFSTTADNRIESNYMLQEAYRKVFK